MKILRGNPALFVSEIFRKKHEAVLQTITKKKKNVESNKTIDCVSLKRHCRKAYFGEITVTTHPHKTWKF